MKNKRNLWCGLAIIMVGLIYLPVRAQQKNGTHRANFQGEWKAKESISMGGNIVCTYIEGDRMLAKTMKIAQQANFLSIEPSNWSPAAAGAVSKPEKLTFGGKANEIDGPPGFGKKFTVKLSADGRIMTVNSIVHFPAAQKQASVNVIEVWKLSNDGNSITVDANAKSTIFNSDERSWTTVFDKVL